MSAGAIRKGRQDRKVIDQKCEYFATVPLINRTHLFTALRTGARSGNPAGPSRDKWAPSTSPLMPPPSPQWFQALGLVNRDSTSELRVPKNRAGLMFPDPGFIAFTEPDRRAAIIGIWLFIRLDRTAQMLHPTVAQLPIVTAHAWRLFFSMSVLHRNDAFRLLSNPTGGGNARADIATAGAIDAARAMFGAGVMQALQQDVRQVTWRGVPIPVVKGAASNLSDTVVREILWELAELEWRYELLALDRIAAASRWREPDADIVRTDMVTQVFAPSNSFVYAPDTFPVENPWITAATRARRLPALQALRNLVVFWPGCPPVLKTRMFVSVLLPPPPTQDAWDFAELEAIMLVFYCQTFFDVFGRPPVLPHRLPEV